MWPFSKNSEPIEYAIPAEETVEEKLSFRGSYTFDDVKKHLVEKLDENRELRERLENINKVNNEKIENARKEAELSRISADEYRKESRGKDGRIHELERNIELRDTKIELLERQVNDLKVEVEMLQLELDRTEQALQDATDKNVAATTKPKRTRKPKVAEEEQDGK